MSLLLTKSCEYALLVSIQQGRQFEWERETSIEVETELDLKLPSSIDDLIPQNTQISCSANIERDGSCDFNVSLVYFVSSKQLGRLRKERAQTTIRVRQRGKEGGKKEVDRLQLSIVEAKEVVPKSAHQLDHIYKFVADKGHWQTLSSGAEIGMGLFYVAMPESQPAKGTLASTRVSTPCIELRSPPPTPKITHTTALSQTAASHPRKKKVNSILGHAHPPVAKKKANEDKRNASQPTLRRSQSSLIDLNIEELADMLRKINIFPSPAGGPSPRPSLAYHQIGKGSLRYTFYFKVLHADHISPRIARSPNSKLKRPYVGWSFLSTYNISPATSFSSDYTHQAKACFHLTGHLVDIGHWLDSLSPVKLNLIMMDKMSKQTAGTGFVHLEDLAFHDRTFDDRLCQVLNANEVVAQITVRLGLISGWQEEPFLPDESHWEDLTRQKKFRPASTVPTLISSSSSKSTTTPTVHYHPPIRPVSQITHYYRNKRHPTFD